MDSGEKVTNNTVKKLYVDDAGMVTFLCPKCGDSRKQSVEKCRDVIGLTKMSCICGYVSEVKLEFRKFFRKDTELEGLYYRSIPEGHWGKMIVKDLSILGCRFEMRRKELLGEGEEIKLQFTLDNPRRSIIRKKAIVSEVEGSNVGCKFVDLPGYIDSELGFYLRKI
jgi:predicted RNA-binding Zn-ribbon protein involved in translation (DUF1610 family)